MPTRNITESFSFSDAFTEPTIDGNYPETITLSEAISKSTSPPPPTYTAIIINLRTGYAKIAPPWTRKFEPWPFGRDAIQISLTERMDTLQLQLSNIAWNRFLGYLRLEDHHGQKVKIWAGFLDIAKEEANLGEMFEGEIAQVNFNEQVITISLKGNASYLDRDGLGRSFSVYCPFKFKSRQCGYVGPDTLCDKSYSDCDSRGNAHRFGGFSTLLVIQGTRDII